MLRTIQKVEWCFLIAVCLGMPGSAYAMELREFIADVVSGDPRVHEQIHGYRQIVEDREIANSGWRPSVDLSASTGKVQQNRPQSDDFDRYQADLTVTQNLFNGYETSHQVDQAKSRISSAVYQILDTADNVSLDGIKAYMSVLAERRLLELANENVESHARILNQINEQSDAGIGRRSDIEQTEGRLANAKAGLEAQKNNLQDALVQVHKLLGRFVRVNEFLPPDTPVLPDKSLEQLINEALEKHPALESARRNIAVAQAAYKSSRNTNYPRLDLQMQQSYGRNLSGLSGRREENSLMLNVSYNLYRGGADAALQRKKASELSEKQAFRARVRRQVIDSLQLSWTAARALNAQLPYLEQHVEKADETLDLYHEEFMLQKRDLTDLLDAEGELNSAKKKYVTAYFDNITARFRIYEAMGELFQILNLNVEIYEDDIVIEDLRASGRDDPGVFMDMDGDRYQQDSDHCDNSAPDSVLSRFGCNNRLDELVPRAVEEAEFDRLSKSFETDPKTEILVIDDLHFAYKREQLDDASVARLKNYLNVMQEYPQIPIEVWAHTDSVGSENYNLRLSNRRAKAIKQWLISEGIEESRIEAIGIGEIQPKADNSTEEGKSANRRAELRMTIPAGINPKQDFDSNKKNLINREINSSPQADSADYESDLLYFAYKKTELSQKSLSTLHAYIDKMSEYPYANLDVRAYTDDIGSKDYNKKLSRQRAEYVKQILIQEGLSPDRIHASGYGESDPIGSNLTDGGRAKNRRVELQMWM